MFASISQRELSCRNWTSLPRHERTSARRVNFFSCPPHPRSSLLQEIALPPILPPCPCAESFRVLVFLIVPSLGLIGLDDFCLKVCRRNGLLSSIACPNLQCCECHRILACMRKRHMRQPSISVDTFHLVFDGTDLGNSQKFGNGVQSAMTRSPASILSHLILNRFVCTSFNIACIECTLDACISYHECQSLT